MPPGFFWTRITDPTNRMFMAGQRSFMVDHTEDAFARLVQWDTVYVDSAREARAWCKENLSGRWHVDQGAYFAFVRVWDDTEATAFMMRFG